MKYLILLIGFSLIGCRLFRNESNSTSSTNSTTVAVSEEWRDTIFSGVTQIKITTSLRGEALREKCSNTVVSCRILLDPAESSTNTWRSTPKGVNRDNRCVISISDSTVFLSAEKKETLSMWGQESTSWNMVSYNESSDRLSWTQIKVFAERLSSQYDVKYK